MTDCTGGIFVAVAALFSTGHGWGPFVQGGTTRVVDLDIFLVGLARPALGLPASER